MIEDDVILGVRAVREAFAASHDYNVRAMVMALRKMDEEAGVPVVSFADTMLEVQSTIPATALSVANPPAVLVATV